MKIRLFLIPALAMFALSGCGQKGPSTSSEGSGSSTASTSTAQSGARTIEITANDQMKFSVTSIEAKPGEELHVVLQNVGNAPKEAMAHNWILLKAGSDAAAFSMQAATAKDTNYVPAALQGEILAKIDLQGPHQTGEVTFKAPEQPGEYPFLCSFPAHYQVGMKGTLTVK